MAASKPKGYLRASVVIDIEVKESEWMGEFGEHIVSNQLVPEVTLVQAVRKGAQEHMAKLGMKSLVVK